MDSINELKIKNEKINRLKEKFKNLKSDFFIYKVFDILTKIKSLEIIKYNKNIQKRLNISINNYKEYSEIYSKIEIEIIPASNKIDKFINIKKDEEIYFHIYLNDNKKEETIL